MSPAANSSVRVLVRCRPLLHGEQDHMSTRIKLSAGDGKVTLHRDPSDDARCFTFDRVYPIDAQQEDIMDEMTPLISHVLSGMHATVFAYGQTGSGKTYTVEGMDYVRNHSNILVPNTKADPKVHGIALRSIQLLFDGARERQGNDDHTRFRLRCSYYQLYNERVTDLLNPSSTRSVDGLRDGGLKIAWTRDNAFRVENLFLCECADAKKMRHVYLSGAREKVMESHAMNYQSSRSHTVFTVYVERWDSNTPECSVKSEFTVVDLAGSEKLSMLSKSPSETLLRESTEINASLFALGKVINALAGVSHKKAKAGETVPKMHIPYRDSKLTKLLKHALGGNSLTTMIACISPLDCYIEESVSTLLYAGRTRNIKNVPYVNEDPKSALIRQLREDVANMKKELSYYRAIAGNTLKDTERALHVQEVGSNNVQSSSSERNADRAASRGEETDDKKQINELADKLIQACEFLKNIIDVNGQLRDSFESIKGAKTELEQRQVELNAENIALRERIEMLESIALDDNFSASSVNRTSNEQRQQKRQRYVAESTTAPPLSPRAETSSGIEKLKKNTRIGSRKDNFVQTNPKALSFSSLNSNPMKRRSLSASNGLREKQGNRISVLEKRLHDYTKRYCQPHRVLNYTDYYGKARQQMPINVVANEAINSMEKVIKELPSDVASAVVPQSLCVVSQFGALSFAGGDTDVAVLEEKRRQRMEKRNALLAQQQALQNNLVRAFSSATEEMQLASIRVAQKERQSPLLYSVASPRGNNANTLSTPALQKATGYGARGLRSYIKKEEAKAKHSAVLQANSLLGGHRRSNSRCGNEI